MRQFITILRSTRLLTLACAMTLLSACATDSLDRRALTSTDMIDVCHTQATETHCYRERTADFAASMEALREQKEMAELESLDDW